MNRTATIVVVILFIAIMLGAIVAGTYMLLKEPDRDEGIPTLVPYANDFAGVLTYDDIELLDYISYIVDDETSCEIAVVVVNSTQPHDINYFALRTFQYNGIGKEGRDNGILVVVATDENLWRVEVGYGLEGILPDVRVKHLAEEFLEPNMTAGYYGQGLASLCDEMGYIILTEYTGETGGDPAYPIDGVPLTWWHIGLIIVVVIVLSIFTKGRIIWPLIWILSLLAGGRGGFGGGRSGGGGAWGKL